jgi:lipopolysaccharide transport system ATP-binding protein
MSQNAIVVENLSKRYRIGKAPVARGGSLWQRIISPFHYLTTTLQAATEEETLWALRDISFEVKAGEVVGIVGHNGAGKSTLLKILSRITEPTDGQATVRGRVGSLLEVGTGFHPELTGRENVFLSGTILGMRSAEIKSKFDEIVAFAGVEKFLDTPVKRYSSGMYVRLAFAVAAHLEPEILLVDEVLAVGDAAFQKQCLGKMSDVAVAGRTVLFVSHNMVAMQNLCERVMWFDHGQIVDQGQTSEVLAKYLAVSSPSTRERIWHEPKSAPGNETVRLQRIAAYPASDQPAEVISRSSPINIEIEYWNYVPNSQLHTVLYLHTEQQVAAFTTSSIDTDTLAREARLPIGLIRSVCHIPGNFLNTGIYRISVAIVQNGHRTIFRQNDMISFEVLDLEKRHGTWYGKEVGAVRPMLDWQTEISQSTQVASAFAR